MVSPKMHPPHGVGPLSAPALPLTVLILLAVGVPLLARLCLPAPDAADPPPFLARVKKTPSGPPLRTPVSTAYQEEALLRKLLYGDERD